MRTTTPTITTSKTEGVGVIAYSNVSCEHEDVATLGASTALTLIMGGASFGQHYTQTNLVSTSGVAPVTDPQLINPWGISRGSGRLAR